MRKLIFLSFLLVFLAGCQTLPHHKVHHRMVADDSMMQSGKILVLPVEVSVQELSAGGLTEEMPKETQQAEQNFNQVLGQHGVSYLTSDVTLEIPEMTEDEQKQFDQSVALVKTVLSDAFKHTGLHAGQAWMHKKKHFDYTMGSGLAFLAEKTGADKALFLLGEDMHSTSGRKATMVLVAALTGAVIPLGHTVVAGGMVDLKTGDILWANSFVGVGQENFLTAKSTGDALKLFFKPYPGVEAYRKLKN